MKRGIPRRSLTCIFYSYSCMHAGNQHTPSIQPLVSQRFNVIDLLHSLCSQYKRMLFLYANTIFNADTHAAEVGRVILCVGDVEAALA